MTSFTFGAAVRVAREFASHAPWKKEKQFSDDLQSQIIFARIVSWGE